MSDGRRNLSISDDLWNLVREQAEEETKRSGYVSASAWIRRAIIQRLAREHETRMKAEEAGKRRSILWRAG
jgi:hypothetical protein